MTKQIFPALKISILAVVFFSGGSYAFAWTAPTASPPGGNVVGPITTSLADQTKAGDICTNKNGLLKCLSTLNASGASLPVATIAGQTVRWDGTIWGNSSTGDLLANGITIGRGSGNLFSNTANGYYALYKNTSGSNNTANGYGTLYNNTTGSNNTANGYYTLLSNTTGYNNTANGAYTLPRNTNGFNNTANGYGALYNNTTGSNNTANGYYTLMFNNGSLNTANGAQSLYSNTTGSSNTANGFYSLFFNTTGYDNTANGAQSLYNNTTGSNNTANGRNALQKNTTGYLNTANGINALFSNTSGSANTANGGATLYSNTTGFSNTASGVAALNNNTTGSHNTAIGDNALYYNTTGYLNTAIGFGALNDNTTGNTNTAIGMGADVSRGDLVDATAIGYGAIVDASNKIRIGGGYVTQIEGTVGWSIGSDMRLKHAIADSDLGLDFINKLRPVSYKLNNGDGGTDYGFIAQEVESALGKPTNIVMTDTSQEKMKTMRYDDLIAPIVKAVQEQQQQINDLQAENAMLKTDNETLLLRIEKIEAKIK